MEHTDMFLHNLILQLVGFNESDPSLLIPLNISSFFCIYSDTSVSRILRGGYFHVNICGGNVFREIILNWENKVRKKSVSLAHLFSTQ